MLKNVVIIGAGGHGKVIADIIQAAGDTVVGFLDDDTSKESWYGVPVLGRVVTAGSIRDCEFVIAIGNNAKRKQLSQQLNLPWYTAIHPSAVLSPTAIVGRGSVIMPGAVINAEARVGMHCIINTGAIVEHENHIADYVHLSPTAALGGQVSIGQETHVGIGACVRNNVSICECCVIGAGAAVVNNINEQGIYVGVPAQKR